MKTKLYFLSLVALAISMQRCDEPKTEPTPEPPVPATGMTLSHHAISVEIDDEFALIHTLEPAGSVGDVVWESSEPTLATVTDGVVKGLAKGTVTVKAKLGEIEILTLVSVRDVPTIHRCAGLVDGWFETLGEISFRTDRIWTVGDQEWSDVVMAENIRTDEPVENVEFFKGYYDQWCEDPTHDHPMYGYDAHSNITRDYGDLFSWCTAVTYRKQLCPDGWRLPDSNDFKELNIALGGEDVGRGRDYKDTTGVIDRYAEEWGAEFGSVCNNWIFMSKPGDVAVYWASNEYFDGYDYTETFMIEINKAVSKVGPEYTLYKNYGMQVRCVRNI